MTKWAMPPWVAMAVLFLAGTASSEDHLCSQQVAFALSEYGIKLSEIKNAQFRTNRFQHEDSKNGAHR
jgi:hypothetical protein